MALSYELHSFASRLTLIPLRANTIGPGLFTKADYAIGGADGCQGNFNWQGQSVRMTLHYGPDPWVPSSWMPTLPGRLFVTTGSVDLPSQKKALHPLLLEAYVVGEPQAERHQEPGFVRLLEQSELDAPRRRIAP